MAQPHSDRPSVELCVFCVVRQRWSQKCAIVSEPCTQGKLGRKVAATVATASSVWRAHASGSVTRVVVVMGGRNFHTWVCGRHSAGTEVGHTEFPDLRRSQ